MWKAAAGQSVSVAVNEDGDDWETDPDFENDVSETEQRWGAKTVEGSGHQEHIDIHKLRDTVSTEHTSLKKKELDKMPKASHGYGGKFGVQQDRMDKSAVGHDYQSKLSKHCSQTDTSKGFGGKFGVQADRVDQLQITYYTTGFGGRYGVQADRVDQSAVGFDYQGKTEKHDSQKDYTKGFGGKFGVETDKVDKSAMGFDEFECPEGRNESRPQTNYVKGFGGKFGVQTDRQDASALGWDHQEKLQLHESQKDYKRGFGGQYGVEMEKQDHCALGYEHKESLAKHESQKGTDTPLNPRTPEPHTLNPQPHIPFKTTKTSLLITLSFPRNTPPPSLLLLLWHRPLIPSNSWFLISDGPSFPHWTLSRPAAVTTQRHKGLTFSAEIEPRWLLDPDCLAYETILLSFPSSAGTFEDVVKPAPAYQKTKPVEAGSIKARFENIAKQKEEEDRKRAEEERVRRQAKEKQEQEEARRKMEETAKAPSPVPAPSPSPSPSPAPPLQAAAAPAYQRLPPADGQLDEYGEDLGLTAVALYDYQA
ncbi:hypothetical protein FQN60_005287, partial [Etheostoma spectabile]